jgi:hypothetical protein
MSTAVSGPAELTPAAFTAGAAADAEENEMSAAAAAQHGHVIVQLAAGPADSAQGYTADEFCSDFSAAATAISQLEPSLAEAAAAAAAEVAGQAPPAAAAARVMAAAAEAAAAATLVLLMCYPMHCQHQRSAVSCFLMKKVELVLPEDAQHHGARHFAAAASDVSTATLQGAPQQQLHS